MISAWKKSKTHSEHNETLKNKLRQDPSLIPEIPVGEYNDFRARFVERHPDLNILEYREPHKKFIERMLRDQIMHDVIPAYKIGEMKLRSETVVHKANLTHTADLLLQVSKEEQPVAVSSEADAINQVTAFFMALKDLGVMTHSKFTKVNGKITGGALSYLGELEKRMVLADETFRKKVHDLMVEDRATFGTNSEALHAAVTEPT